MLWLLLGIVVSALYTVYSLKRTGEIIGDIEDYHLDHSSLSVFGRIFVTFAAALICWRSELFFRSL
jgi:hypothetical protein